MYKGLSEETIRSEMGEEAIVYTVHRKGADDTYVSVPSGNNEPAVYFFLSENDAKHFGLLLNQITPNFKGVEMEVLKGPVGNVLKTNLTIAIIPPNEAKRFFEEYEEFLGHYYGL
jgi:hypothetical protein